MRSPSRAASRTLWVTKTIVVPVELPDRLELVVHHVACHRVECPERFIHQQDVGVLGERAGQRDSLSHPARQLVRTLVGEVRQVHELQQLLDSITSVGPLHVAQLECQIDVGRRR